jgi:hypothetical protein
VSAVDEPRTRPVTPEPEFAVTGAAPAPSSAAPALVFTLRAVDTSGRDVYTVALTAQILLQPARRSYDEEARGRLVELFGTPDRWRETIDQTIVFAQADALLPSFSGETTFELRVPLTYDLEVASAKYVDALRDGHVPLTFTFTGTVFYRDESGRLQLVKVPWSANARFRLPVEVWRRAIESHFGAGGWIRLHADTLERLQRLKAERGLPSFDACLDELLAEGGA